MQTEDIARAIYGAFNDQGPNPWKDILGQPMPAWENLPLETRVKWCAAARTAKILVVEGL